MEVWDHDGKLYEVNSWYCLPDDAWQYELVELTEPPGRGACLAVVIPDATPEPGPFTPKHADHVLLAVARGVTPWPILRRLIDLVESSGDIVATDRAHATADDEILSNNVWLYAGKRFEVNSFHLSDRDAWCYELYEVKPDASRNDYVEIQIPDANPDAGPFVPEPSDRVTFTVHGEWDIPWPVFRRFIEVITASGDIVQDQPNV
ncbi:hypothetical protein ACFT9M_25515 [Micromonospora purpureochromogenes]|uniref:hypothetical protein n=1 Tax=Micromonospora purpureochromogenes TaxID=47872 RepID=UPI0036425B17